MPDLTTRVDTLTPEEFVQEIDAALPRLSNTEAARLLEHARAWAIVCYPEQIPEALDSALTDLEDKWHAQTN
jgi:hypothetical protein